MTPRPTRRRFVACTASVAAAGTFLSTATPVPTPPKFRCAVIGHTGRGDYGHGMELIFNDRDDCEVVAVADPDEQFAPA